MGLVLIQGAEGLLADRAISKILATNPAATITTLIADEIEVGAITDSLAPSLFGDARIVVIKEIQDLVADCSDEIIEYLSNPDESLNLVLWHKGGVKGKALVDKVKKAGAEVISAEAIKKDSDKAEFVRGEFKNLGRKISTEAVQALIDSLGSDLRELGGACSQLASDVQDGKLIDEDDAVEVVLQINGKIIDRLDVSPSISKENLEIAARANEKVAAALAGVEVKKAIVVPPKLVNFVI